MKSNNISHGTQLTFNGSNYYYDCPADEYGSHYVYYTVPNWPFPKRLILNREEFTITRLKNKLDKLIDIEDALF
jgi:hypothetical protein